MSSLPAPSGEHPPVTQEPVPQKKWKGKGRLVLTGIFGICTSPQTPGELSPDLDPLSRNPVQGLQVGIDRHELHSGHLFPDHGVHRVATASPHSHNQDPGLQKA